MSTPFPEILQQPPQPHHQLPRHSVGLPPVLSVVGDCGVAIPSSDIASSQVPGHVIDATETAATSMSIVSDGKIRANTSAGGHANGSNGEKELSHGGTTTGNGATHGLTPGDQQVRGDASSAGVEIRADREQPSKSFAIHHDQYLHQARDVSNHPGVQFRPQGQGQQPHHHQMGLRRNGLMNAGDDTAAKLEPSTDELNSNHNFQPLVHQSGSNSHRTEEVDRDQENGPQQHEHPSIGQTFPSRHERMDRKTFDLGRDDGLRTAAYHATHRQPERQDNHQPQYNHEHPPPRVHSTEHCHPRKQKETKSRRMQHVEQGECPASTQQSNMFAQPQQLYRPSGAQFEPSVLPQTQHGQPERQRQQQERHEQQPEPEAHELRPHEEQAAQNISEQLRTRGHHQQNVLRRMGQRADQQQLAPFSQTFGFDKEQQPGNLQSHDDHVAQQRMDIPFTPQRQPTYENGMDQSPMGQSGHLMAEGHDRAVRSHTIPGVPGANMNGFAAELVVGGVQNGDRGGSFRASDWPNLSAAPAVNGDRNDGEHSGMLCNQAATMRRSASTDPTSMQQPTRKRQKRSKVWKFFKESPSNMNHALCLLCNASIPRGRRLARNTTNLLKHLQSKHPVQLAASEHGMPPHVDRSPSLQAGRRADMHTDGGLPRTDQSFLRMHDRVEKAQYGHSLPMRPAATSLGIDAGKPVVGNLKARSNQSLMNPGEFLPSVVEQRGIDMQQMPRVSKPGQPSSHRVDNIREKRAGPNLENILPSLTDHSTTDAFVSMPLDTLQHPPTPTGDARLAESRHDCSQPRELYGSVEGLQSEIPYDASSILGNDHGNSKTDYEISAALIEYAAREALPLSRVVGPGVQGLLQAFGYNGHLPSEFALRSQSMPALIQNVRIQAREKLRSATACSLIVSDAGFHRVVSCIWLSDRFEHQMICLDVVDCRELDGECHSDSGYLARTNAARIAQDYGIFEKVRAIVMFPPRFACAHGVSIANSLNLDGGNGSNSAVGFDVSLGSGCLSKPGGDTWRGGQKMPRSPHDLTPILCSATVLDRILSKEVFSNPLLDNMLRTIRNAVRTVRDNTSMHARNMESVGLGGESPLILDEEAGVSMWTTRAMLDRFAVQRDAIEMTLKNSGSTVSVVTVDVTEARKLRDVLSVFVDALRILDPTSGASRRPTDSSIAVTIPVVKGLKGALKSASMNENTVAADFSQVLESLHAAVEQEFSSMESRVLYAIATVLDPRFKTGVFDSAAAADAADCAVRLECDRMAAMGYATPPLGNRRGTGQFGNFDSGHAQSLAEYLAEPMVTFSTNVEEFWRSNKDRWPTLARVALIFLCIPASSRVPCANQRESGHSIDGNVCFGQEDAASMLFVRSCLSSAP